MGVPGAPRQRAEEAGKLDRGRHTLGGLHHHPRRVRARRHAAGAKGGTRGYERRAEAGAASRARSAPEGGEGRQAEGLRSSPGRGATNDARGLPSEGWWEEEPSGGRDGAEREAAPPPPKRGVGLLSSSSGRIRRCVEGGDGLKGERRSAAFWASLNSDRRLSVSRRSARTHLASRRRA